MAAGSVGNIPHPHIGMPDRNAFQLLEAQTEQPCRRVEGGLDDPVQLQIGLGRRLIDIVQALAQLLGVIAPVPGRDLEIPALRLNQCLQGVAVGECALQGARPHGTQKLTYGAGRLGHLIVKAIIGISRIAEQLRALGPQRHQFCDDRLVVGRPVIVSARDPGAKRLLAQVPP